MPTLTSDELLERARRLIGSSPTSEPCNRFSGDPLHGSCCGHSYALHLVNWLATDLHRVIEAQEATQKAARQVSHWLAADVTAGPKCPTCGLVMCQQFDERPLTPLATLATPNGTYRCYDCTPITRAEALA